MCVFILQEHSYYLGDHKTLPIEDAATPERYSVEKCLTHKKQDIEEICKLCKKLFCDRCRTREPCPAADKQGKTSKHGLNRRKFFIICTIPGA